MSFEYDISAEARFFDLSTLGASDKCSGRAGMIDRTGRQVARLRLEAGVFALALPAYMIIHHMFSMLLFKITIHTVWRYISQISPT